MSTTNPNRRSYGSGSLTIQQTKTGPDTYYGIFRDLTGRQVKRRIGPIRTPHVPDGLTKTQAEARLRDVMQDQRNVAPAEHARTLEAAMNGWLNHLEATGIKASSIRAYRAAITGWFLPTYGGRPLDKITADDVETVMRKMRSHGLSDKTIRNYVGALRALYNFARDRRRRWTVRNPVDDIDLPKAPTYAEIRYLRPEEIGLLVNAPDGPLAHVDRALYLTAAMTGLRIGELQALDWRSVDIAHSRLRVRRTWDRKTKTYTTPKSRRSERAVPMPDAVTGELERMFRHSYPDIITPEPGALVFGDPVTGDPLGHRAMYERLRTALRAAGLDTAFGFHSLRHSYGTALAAQGVPMRKLQEYMGHVDIQTTQRYADYCPNVEDRGMVEAAFANVTFNVTICPTTA